MSSGNGIITDKSRLSLPISLVVTILVSIVTGTISATGAAYAVRDKTLEQMHLEVVGAIATTRMERASELRFYLPKDEFSEWKQKERIRQDQQFYTLLNAIDRLSSRIGAK